jgi:RHS repeat-associated protein
MPHEAVYQPCDGISPALQPYKFGGKEYDEMHGLNWYDFETRYYSGIIPAFMTIDPLAEKYYSVSPYAYCMNNPVKYVDPDGREIMIHFLVNGQNYGWRFNGSNHSSASNNQFVKNTLAAYNYNVKNGGGDQMKAAATATDYTLNLVQTEGGSNFETTFNGPRTEGTAFWNPTEGLETPKGTLSPATILEHEMDHGVNWQTNTEEHIKGQKTSDPHFENKEEKRVITGSEYKTGVANGELNPVVKGKESNSSSYRGHMENSGNTSVITVSPISNEKKKP